jgi:hypothetical protein
MYLNGCAPWHMPISARITSSRTSTGPRVFAHAWAT